MRRLTRADHIAGLSRALLARGADSSDFDLNSDIRLPEGRVLRPASVLIPVYADRAVLILTKRSGQLKHHPGQIAFPGGKQDPTDASPTAAALREAHEEIGLSPSQVEVLGTLPTHETVTGYAVTPVVGLVHGPFAPIPEAGEVDEVFEVPLDHVLNPARYRVEGRRWQGRRRYYFAVPYGPYYIWGATARILRALAERSRDP